MHGSARSELQRRMVPLERNHRGATSYRRRADAVRYNGSRMLGVDDTRPRVGAAAATALVPLIALLALLVACGSGTSSAPDAGAASGTFTVEAWNTSLGDRAHPPIAGRRPARIDAIA